MLPKDFVPGIKDVPLPAPAGDLGCMSVKV